MADQRTDGTDANRATVAMQRIYLKDSSFEAPNSPDIFGGEWRPSVQLNIGSQTKDLGNHQYECILTVNVEAKQGDKIAFLIEVQQGGVFLFDGLDETNLQRALVAFCPQQLYPFAREVVADLSGKGGFPALHLQPVNFEAVAAEAYRRQQAEQAEQTGAAPEPTQ